MKVLLTLGAKKLLLDSFYMWLKYYLCKWSLIANTLGKNTSHRMKTLKIMESTSLFLSVKNCNVQKELLYVRCWFYEKYWHKTGSGVIFAAVILLAVSFRKFVAIVKIVYNKIFSCSIFIIFLQFYVIRVIIVMNLKGK